MYTSHRFEWFMRPDHPTYFRESEALGARLIVSDCFEGVIVEQGESNLNGDGIPHTI